jgi:hypothetical protein
MFILNTILTVAVVCVDVYWVVAASGSISSEKAAYLLYWIAIVAVIGCYSNYLRLYRHLAEVAAVERDRSESEVRWSDMTMEAVRTLDFQFLFFLIVVASLIACVLRKAPV